MKSVFEGIGVALVTPFINNEIDFFSLKSMINKAIEEGASAIVILATTGEGTTISNDEKTKIIKFCKELIGNRAKLVVSTGTNDTKKAIRETLQAKLLGADAVLAVTPYYNKTTQKGIIEYYNSLACARIPIIMYNVPARTGLDIEPKTIKKILKTNPYVYGIKESTTDICRINELMNICKNKIAVYSGEDDLNHIFYFLGGLGAISVTANLKTKECVQLYEHVKSGDISSATLMQKRLHSINQILFCEVNPIPIKEALFQSNMIGSNEVRAPLVTLSDKHKKKMSQILRHF